MSTAFRFLHVADIHLGCAPDGQGERFADFGKAFAFLVDAALRERVDAMLIAGDLFHQRAIDAATLLLASGQLQRLREADIAVIAIEGNHDKAYYLQRQSWMQYLDAQGLLTLLRPAYDGAQPVLAPYALGEGNVWEYRGVRFVGFGYLGASTRERLLSLGAQLAPFVGHTVGLLHAAVDKLLEKDMAGIRGADVAALADKISYLALGHIHTRQEVLGFAYNPGAPECVHLSEGKSGEKGAYLVTLDGAGVHAQFLPSARRACVYARCDLTGADSAEAAMAAAMRAVAEANPAEGAMVSLQLMGAPAFAVQTLDTRALEQALCEAHALLLASVENATAQAAAQVMSGTQLEALEREVLEQLLAQRGRGGADTVLALKEGLLRKDAPEALCALVERGAREVRA